MHGKAHRSGWTSEFLDTMAAALKLAVDQIDKLFWDTDATHDGLAGQRLRHRPAKQLAHSGVKASLIRLMADQSPSTVRYPAFRSMAFSLAKAFSMGLKLSVRWAPRRA